MKDSNRNLGLRILTKEHHFIPRFYALNLLRNTKLKQENNPPQIQRFTRIPVLLGANFVLLIIF
jgi:hypothetical protein